LIYVHAAGARRERNNNKHKRLFTGGPGALENGQNLYYKTAAEGVLLRSGVAVINPDGVSGIRCDCCDAVRSTAVLQLVWRRHRHLVILRCGY
jgi:hypothetical protein